MRAHLVPLLAARQHLLGGVHGLAAHRALGHLHWLERHRGSQVQELELGILTSSTLYNTTYEIDMDAYMTSVHAAVCDHNCKNQLRTIKSIDS